MEIVINDLIESLSQFPDISDPFMFGSCLSVILYVGCCSLMLIGLIIKKIKGRKNHQIGPAIFIIYFFLAPFFSTFITLGVFKESDEGMNLFLYLGSAFAFLVMGVPSLLTFIDSLTGFSDKASSPADEKSRGKKFDKIINFLRIMVFLVVFLITISVSENYFVAFASALVAMLIVIPFRSKKILFARELFLKAKTDSASEVDDDNILENEQEEELEEDYKVIKAEGTWNMHSRSKGFNGNLRVVLIVALLFCGLIGFVEYRVLTSVISVLRDFTPVKGKVIDNSDLVQYTYESKTFSSHPDFSCSPSCFDMGEEVELLVDPQNPKKFSVNSFLGLWLPPVLVAVFFFIFLLIPIILIKSVFKNRGRPVVKKFMRIESVQQLATGKFRLVVKGSFTDLKVKYEITTVVPEEVGRYYRASSTLLEVAVDPKDYCLEIFWDRNKPKLSMIV